jgi:cullin-associated NEDD8-dissociated protein 1
MYSYSSGVPSGLPPTLMSQIKPYLSVSDISLLSQALTTLSILLEVAPAATFPEVEKTLLSDIYNVSHSPLISGSALDSLLHFYDALVSADQQIATHVLPNLVLASEKAPKGSSNPVNVGKCVAQVVKSCQAVAAGAIAEYSKNLKVRHVFWVEKSH